MGKALDWKHNQAIRREVGERLSFLLSSTSNELPTRLRDLVRQIERREHWANAVHSQSEHYLWARLTSSKNEDDYGRAASCTKAAS